MIYVLEVNEFVNFNFKNIILYILNTRDLFTYNVLQLLLSSYTILKIFCLLYQDSGGNWQKPRIWNRKAVV